MKKAVQKFTACCLAMGMTLAGTGLNSMADPKEPSAKAEAGVKKEEKKIDTSMKGAQAFASCEEYVNVRAEADIEGEPLGKLRNHDSMTILAKIDDWYLIQSGNLVGYVKSDYILCGEDAIEAAAEAAYNVAKVNADALMIRTAPSEDAESFGMAEKDQELEVVAREGEWMKVALGGDSYGYVNGNYTDYKTYYPTGETLQEEQARLDREWLAYLAQQEAKRQAEEAAYAAYIAQQEAAYAAYVAQQEAAYAAQQRAAAQQAAAQEQVTYSASVGDSEQAAADSAWQAYLEAQAVADEATTGMDEQAVYDTAAAAEAAYAEYLSAQYAADQASVASYTDTASSYNEASYYEADYSESSAQSAADEAWQAYLDAQAAADEATTGIDEQAVYDSAKAAEDAYAEYLSAQAVADEEAVAARYADSQETSSPAAVQESDSSSQDAADAAWQDYLDAQAAADEATTGTDEQAVYDTAAAAEEAYAKYLSAQAAADEDAVNGNSTPSENSQEMNEAEADDDSEDDLGEDAYVEDSGEVVDDETGYTGDDTWTEDIYVEDDSASYSEPSYQEAVYTEPSYSSAGSSIVNFATQYVGNPYVYGGTSLTSGADCSGFVQTVFSNFGISLPRTAAEQSSGGTSVSLSDLQPGDLLFYYGDGGIGHVTIYMGDGQVVHASNPSTGITISDYGYRTPAFAKRYT